MSTILIEVKLPAADISYDLRVPDTMQIGTLTSLASSVFTELSNGIYHAGLKTVLCEQKTGKEYDVNSQIRDTDICNGTKLYLF